MKTMKKVERGELGGPSTVYVGRVEVPGKRGQPPAVRWTGTRVRRVPVEVGPASRAAYEQAAAWFNCGWADLTIKLSADAKWHRFELSARGRKTAFAVREGSTPAAFGHLAQHFRRLNAQKRA